MHSDKSKTLNASNFVNQIFEEYKDKPAIFYSKFEDPYENETQEPYGREIFQKKRSASIRIYPPGAYSKSSGGSGSINYTPSPNFMDITSPTFHKNAPEFLRKFNSEEVQKEPQDLDIIGQYTLGPIIGTGAFSTVRKCHLTKDVNREFAVKVTDKNSCDKSLLEKARTEIALWKGFKHPNIVDYIETIEINRYIFVFCELCANGKLFDYVVDQPDGCLQEKEARKYFIQLLSALEYLHGQNIVHRDIKLENLLLDDEFNLKVCDFGFSEQLDKNQDDLEERDCGGTLLYCPPEVIQPGFGHNGDSKGKWSIGTEADIWSSGVSLFAMTTGELPFDDDYQPRLKQQILSGKFTFPECSLSKELQDLIRGMLKTNPKDRLTLKEIQNHPWVTKT